ncbi:MAG: Arsenate-mycothiol transferase ArsC2 [Syntrophorhabdaceae bacterium PtaU1.Bin034]|nr:MAG: Arsenate-mycothiol transferase ArsC2 [Syntrophorhabdaceae bacterium PtaU1.Bin034]
MNGDFKRRVLFVCIHNAARSQMAEAFLNRIGERYFEAESAGMDPTEINPLVVEVMAEVGIDLSGAKTKSVFDLYRSGEEYSYVITVCDEAHERCPLFPGPARRISWNFQDPATFQGSREETLVMTRKVRDEVRAKVEEFVRDFESRLESPT